MFNRFYLKPQDPLIIGILKMLFLPILLVLFLSLISIRSIIFLIHYFQIKLNSEKHTKRPDKINSQKSKNLILLQWKESTCLCGKPHNDTLERTIIEIVKDF